MFNEKGGYKNILFIESNDLFPLNNRKDIQRNIYNTIFIKINFTRTVVADDNIKWNI